jgi:hypothetical protein
VLVLGLSGCAAGFVYNRLDWLVSWYVNGLVSLDSAQEQQLHDMVHRTLDWHRSTQLPRYISLLEEMADETAQPVSADRLEQRYQNIAGLLDDFLQHVVPDAAGLLRTLSPDQVAELKENMTVDNEDLWEEFAGNSPEVRQKRRTKNAMRALQRFVGRLSEDQRVTVATRVSAMHDVSDQWLDRRQHWQRRFFDLLLAPPPGALFDAALLDLALNPNQFDSGDYRRTVDGNRRAVMEMIAELSHGFSSQQREHLRRKFREYGDDLRRITAAG